MLGQITVFRVSLWFQSNVLEVSMCRFTVKCVYKHAVQALKVMEEKAGSRGKIPRNNSKRMSMPALWREFPWFLILLPVRIKLAGPTRKNQSSSKLRQFRK